MEHLSSFLTRVAIGAIVTTVFCAAAVYFVVDQSLRGMEAALMASNARISDVRQDIQSVEAALVASNTRIADVRQDIQNSESRISEQLRKISEKLDSFDQASAENTQYAHTTRSMADEHRIGLVVAYGSLNRLIGSMELLAAQDEGVREALVNLKGEVRTNCLALAGSDLPAITSIQMSLQTQGSAQPFATHPCLYTP
jgi:septal ring factor EnvC (AmiA/AmiB activator)